MPPFPLEGQGVGDRANEQHSKPDVVMTDVGGSKYISIKVVSCQDLIVVCPSDFDGQAFSNYVENLPSAE